jgi:hypothetical protein
MNVACGIGLISVGLLASGCASTFAVSPAQNQVVSIFPTGTAVAGPVRSVLGRVRAHSCRYPYTPAAADADAILQLQQKAATLGANGLVSVEVSRLENGGKNPCWRESVAVGAAVVFGNDTSRIER